MANNPSTVRVINGRFNLLKSVITDEGTIRKGTEVEIEEITFGGYLLLRLCNSKKNRYWVHYSKLG